jgi:hypothetical protein
MDAALASCQEQRRPASYDAMGTVKRWACRVGETADQLAKEKGWWDERHDTKTIED